MRIDLSHSSTNKYRESKRQFVARKRPGFLDVKCKDKILLNNASKD